MDNSSFAIIHPDKEAAAMTAAARPDEGVHSQNGRNQMIAKAADIVSIRNICQL